MLPIDAWKRHPFAVLAVILLLPVVLQATSIQITGAPSGLTNQANPVISLGGAGILSFKFKLDGGDYSPEMPVTSPITFSAGVAIDGLTFTAGHKDLQDYLDARHEKIDSVVFDNVLVDTPVVFLLNSKRAFLQADNFIYLEGTNIDQLDVHMNNSPDVPAVIQNQSFATNPQTVTYRLQSSAPQTDFIRIMNRSSETASFKINLNNKFFASDGDVAREIQGMLEELPGETLARKAWRFIRDNRTHEYPLSDYPWTNSSPALFFNSIGFGFCGDAAKQFCQLMTWLGFQARIWGLEGHVVAEALVDGRWKMYDPDLEVYYLNDQGQVAGVEELAAQPDLITNPRSPLPDTLHKVDLEGTRVEYSRTVADLYSSTDNNTVASWQYDDSIQDYSLTLQVPAGGTLDFPSVFAAPVHTSFYSDSDSYTNARLTIPRGWSGALNTPLVIHAIGYDGEHTLSVIGKDQDGTWQSTPTIAQWTVDSWAPRTKPVQNRDSDLQWLNPDYPVDFVTTEPGTIYYTLDGSAPTTASPVYQGPFTILPATILKFRSLDLAGNLEPEQTYHTIDYDPPAVSSVTLTMDKTSPQRTGERITFVAAASGGSGSYEYYFTFWNPNQQQWITGQSYSSDATWTWNTDGLGAGEYSIQVWARSEGSAASWEAYKGVSYTILPPPVSGVTLVMDKESPQHAGAVITFAGTASGGSGSYEYYFTFWNPNTNQWAVGHPYSRNATWTWDTAGLPAGTYSIQVWARNEGSTAEYEAYVGIPYTIAAPLVPPVSTVTLAMDIASPQPAGSVITFTASASGGSGNYQYYFTYWNPNTNRWDVGHPYNTDPTWSWNTAGLGSGTYSIQVWAKNAGSTASYEATNGTAYTISSYVPPPVTSVSLAMDNASPQPAGSVITFTASAFGGSGSYQYYFTYWNPNTGKWDVGHPYNSDPTWTWNTAGLGTGAFSIQVWARNAGSTAPYEAYKGTWYTITADIPPPVTSVTLAMDYVSPQPAGSVITFTASASGGSGNYEYYFTYWNPNTSRWDVGHPYNSDPTWTWNTAGLGTGTFSIQVWARSKGSTADYEAYMGIAYRIGN